MYLRAGGFVFPKSFNSFYLVPCDSVQADVRTGGCRILMGFITMLTLASELFLLSSTDLALWKSACLSFRLSQSIYQAVATIPGLLGDFCRKQVTLIPKVG